MIVKQYDFGWGREWELKQFEKEILDEYLKPLIDSPKKIVIINSTWYSKEYHAVVAEELRQMDVDAIVLVAFIDCAIPNKSWFSDFDIPVYELGYYDGPHNIDFWSLVCEKYYTKLTFGEVSQCDMSVGYMCLNRKPHWHRVKLIAQLEKFNLLQHGYVSLGSENSNQPQIKLARDSAKENRLAPNAGSDNRGIINDIVTLGSMENWNNHLVNIVTETVYDINSNHFVTEKTWKPIIGFRPFFIYDTDLGSKWLTNRGFETYANDFADLIDGPVNTPNAVLTLLIQLSRQQMPYYKHKLLDLKEKLLYNNICFIQHTDTQKRKIKEGILCQI